MELFSLKATSQSPKIEFDLIKGNLLLKGRSIPEDAIGFYQPLFEAIDVYTKSAANETMISIQFEYFNTTSSISILQILKKFEEIHLNGKKVIVNWIYEDEDIMESGEDYQTIINLPFRMIQMTTE